MIWENKKQNPNSRSRVCAIQARAIRVSVLLIDSNSEGAELIQSSLAAEMDIHSFVCLPNITDAIEYLRSGATRPDIVLLDMDVSCLADIKAHAQELMAIAGVPVIGIARPGDKAAEEFLRERGQCCVVKDVDLGIRLPLVVCYTLACHGCELGLRHDTENFYRLVEINPDGIVLIDGDGVIQYVNNAAQQMFSRPKDQLVGQEFGYPVSSDTKTDIEVFNSKGIIYGEMRLASLEWDSRDVTLVAIRDVSERKRLERNLRSSMEELKRSNKDLEQFAFVVSHDLQEPIRTIEGYLGVLNRRHGNEMSEEARECLDRVAQGAAQMQGLIDGLMEIARVGVEEMDLQEVDTEDIVRSVMDSLHASIEESGAKITYDSLPDIVGDSRQIFALFQNLIDNAIKFYDANSPRVHISAERTGSKIEFSVRDNGIGIDTEKKELVFSIFGRCSQSQNYPGMGIGLASCKKIVERHGGEIWFDSEPGNGTTFKFTIACSRSS